MRKPDSPEVYVRLFGGPQVLRDDAPLPLSPHQSCLLALAYGSGAQGIARAEVAWLLWEADDTPTARHRISQLLYGLRRRAGVACIDEATPDSVRGTLPSDLSDFHRLLHTRGMSDLRDTVQRTFLSEIVPPTAAYAHWVDGKRASFRKSVREVGSAELSGAEAAADWRRVAKAAELLLDLDMTDESILRRLLQARALSGSRPEADAALRSHAERYRAVTGERWVPERATSLLLARIEHIERVSLHRATTRQPDLVGRTTELQRLHESLSTRTSSVRFTVVAGEAGMGKTRLIREALARLRLEGCTVLESGSSQLQRDLALHSLLGALSDARVVDRLKEMEEPWKSSLAVLLPHLPLESGFTPPTLDPQATSRRLMEALYQLMGRVAAGGPTVLFLDDLQWLDKTTLCAMEFLSERTPALDLQVVFGLRNESDQDPSLRSFLDLVHRQGTWIELDELPLEAADQLVVDVAPGPLAASQRKRLITAAGRSPFFLIELVTDFCRQGVAFEHYDPAQRVPSSIRQLIATRLESLSREGRTLLQLLSVTGQLLVDAPVPLEDVPASHVPDIADDLLRARLIEYEAGTIRFRHDLIRQTTYDLMGPIKRATLHARAAEAILSRVGEAAHAEAALHYDRAGHRPKAFQYARSAAGTARASGAVPEAILFWETARRNASTNEEVEASTQSLAELLYDARRLEEAVPLLEAAVHTCRDESALRFALMRLDAMSELPAADQLGCLQEVERIEGESVTAGQWDRYVEAVEIKLRILDRLHREEEIRKQLRALSDLYGKGIPASPYAHCLMHMILSLLVLYEDDDSGLVSANEAVRLADEHQLDRLSLRAFQRVLFCHMLRGDFDGEGGREMMRAALAHTAESGDLKSKANIYNIVGCFYLDTGDHEQAERLFRAAETLAAGPSERALIRGNLGEILYCRGDYGTAEAYFREALAEAERQPVHGFISVAVAAGLGLCALATGRLSEAQSYEQAVRSALGSWVHDPYPLVRFLAELERRRGRVSEAIQLIRTRAAMDTRRRTYWIRTKVLEARYLRLVDRAAAEELWKQLEEETAKRGLVRLLHV